MVRRSALPHCIPLGGAYSSHVMSTSREAALQIATRHLQSAAKAEPGVVGNQPSQPSIPRVTHVLAADELAFRAPSIYGLPVPLDACWIACVESQFFGLHSSRVILISRASGEVVYDGSANDEG